MPIIIPTSFSTYADATKTEGGSLRKYVLAQFREDAKLDWVGRLRASMVVDELKYVHFLKFRPRLRENKQLWSEVEKGVGQATIIVIDPGPIQTAIRKALEAEGAEDGHDFNNSTLISKCATAIVGGTPIAYLPSEMIKVIPLSSYEDYGTLESYTPENILAKLGGSLSAASIFAARAHAVFDVESLADTEESTRDAFRSPLSHIILAEILSTTRFFDKEDIKSVKVLNEITNVISNQMEMHFPSFSIAKKGQIIREVDSRSIDHIQAADIAAGWAREILELSNERALAHMFEKVWINGNKVK